MKKILALLITLSLSLFGEGFYDKGETKGITVELSSPKPLTEGNNDIVIKLSKDGKAITDAKVKAKFFMPEMPGMPYMEYKDDGMLEQESYKTTVNLPMGGTWQYHILFKIGEKKYRYKGSVNLGQNSTGSMKCETGKCGSGM